MRTSMLAVALIIVVTLAGWADRRLPSDRPAVGSVARGGHPPIRPSAIPEFATLARLLRESLDLPLAAPAGPAGSSAGLVHYQRFVTAGGAVDAVFEEHRDGTVYLAYTAPRSPEWYDVSRAEDLAGPRSQAVRAGRGRKAFGDLLRSNVAESRWLTGAQAFPPGLSPAPHWLTFTLPLSDPCAVDRHKLSELERLLRKEPATRLPRLLWEAERPVRRLEAQRLTRKVERPACRPRVEVTWQTLGAQVSRLVPRITEPLQSPGDYCFRDVVGVLDPLKTGPPSWQVILPESDEGQRLLEPGHYASWSELQGLTQTDPARAERILKWNGHPTREEVTDHRIPWVSSAIDGVVTESFLSGSDYTGNHFTPPEGYWLGTTGPTLPQWTQCGVLEAVHALCNDWITFLTPDPEYRFTLTRETHPEPGEDAGRGNFTGELQGNLENEIEQWMVPTGYRPEPGDRIHMTGRWVIDCGHSDWHGELHPVESYASSHQLGDSTVASVVVTGDWAGGELDLEVWPPARPNSHAAFAWKQEGRPVFADLAVTELAEPADNPNHLRIHVVSRQPRSPLVTGDWGEVEPHPSRRLAARYRLYWTRS